MVTDAYLIGENFVGEVTKFFASNENFSRRKISPTNNFTRRITDFKNVENYGMSRMQYFMQKQG